jgi:maleylpyruvate isomerase
VRSSEAVDQEFADCPADLWDAPILLGSGEERPASHLAASRWREVEVHHVDLGLSYGVSDWDASFVARFLPNVLTSLTSRTDAAELLAWGLGRRDAPLLSPWG